MSCHRINQIIFENWLVQSLKVWLVQLIIVELYLQNKDLSIADGAEGILPTDAEHFVPVSENIRET